MKINETEQNDRTIIDEDNITKQKKIFYKVFRDIVAKTKFTFFSTNYFDTHKLTN